MLVGINLLREGLDIPECGLVAILDADKEGFLRSETSLIQTIGRAARNVDGRVILYADRMTGSMERAIAETDRRREKQHEYNIEHGITPATIKRDIHDIVADTASRDSVLVDIEAEGANNLVGHNLRGYIEELEKKMRAAAADLEFEEAGTLARRNPLAGGNRAGLAARTACRRAEGESDRRQAGDAEDAVWENAAEVWALVRRAPYISYPRPAPRLVQFGFGKGANCCRIERREQAGNRADPATITDHRDAVQEIAVGQVEEQIFPPHFGLDPAELPHHLDHVEFVMTFQQFFDSAYYRLIFVPADRTVDGHFEKSSGGVCFDFEHGTTPLACCAAKSRPIRACCH